MIRGFLLRPEWSEFVQSIVRVLGFHWYAAEDLFDRTHHHQLYDNHDVTYVSCFPGVNTGVVRYTSTPDAENFMEQNYAPDGVLENPVLTMHALFDPVPAGHGRCSGKGSRPPGPRLTCCSGSQSLRPHGGVLGLGRAGRIR